MVDQGGNGYGDERPSGKLSRSSWRGLISGVAALALAASTATAFAQEIHANVLVTNSALGSGGLGGQLLGYSAGQKGTQKPTTTLSGANNFLIGPSGVAVDLPVGLEGVTSGLANLVTFYQLGASGNTGPAAPPFANPKFTPPFPVAFPLNLDTGIAPQVDGRVWVSSISPPICAVTAIASCTTTSADICGSGSISRWTVGKPLPDLVIGGCPAKGTPAALASEVFAPIGLFDDNTQAVLCADSAVTSGPQGACAKKGQTQVSFLDPTKTSNLSLATNRVWAVNSLGFVSIYLPEVAAALGLEAPTNTAFPPAPATNVFVSEPPLGGFFATTTDNLLPPPLGHSSDTTSPKYIAVNEAQTTAFITDTALGARRTKTKGQFGRVKEFALTTVPTFQTCLLPVKTLPTGCALALQNPLILGAFSTSIEGRGTQLNVPQGIVTFTIPGSGDFVMVANTGSNKVTEYPPGASGNTPPDAVLSGPGGRVHTLDQPVGLSLTPVP